MRVADLKGLSLKILACAERQKTEEYFQHFLNLLQQALRGYIEQSISEHKDNLLASLRSFDQMPLTYGERNLFQTLSYDHFVGGKAAAGIEGILHDEKFDPAGVLQSIEKKLQDFKEFIERNLAVQAGLQFVPAVQENSLREGEALLEITFGGDAAVENMMDFEWMDRWVKIVRAFSELVGEKPEHTRIVRIQKSSPMIVALATAPALAMALGKAVNMVLVMTEKHLRIKAQAEEVRKLNLDNKKIEKDLLAEAEIFSEKSVREIANILAAEVRPKSSLEVASGISLAIKTLFLFVDKGGRIDCHQAADDAQTEDISAIYEEIGKLRSIKTSAAPPYAPPRDEAERDMSRAKPWGILQCLL